ncbi:MAG TPA: hypothetical protein VK395_11765, partial [Gemmataceae bacterium]|nr:hypothetical protein [Gemmataceae bacterium]
MAERSGSKRLILAIGEAPEVTPYLEAVPLMLGANSRPERCPSIFGFAYNTSSTSLIIVIVKPVVVGHNATI